ncbi:dTDP-4-dehydrorhamnose 3,5-epimerase [Flavicella sp.]|uniref:dTDP-4-dehydrorhamnose 3,5-epimerase n=1 Tax=Flavicella sp. TaxID=2957742 RepID=UPI0030175EB5
MKITKTKIPEVLVFEPSVFGDDRGYFMETFRLDEIQKYIGNVNFVQDNESFSEYGVLRGLHFQRPPFTQSKLVRVMQGEVLDVAVDIRLGSPTYGEHVSVLLTGENKKQLWVPQGFAHGFVVLSKTAQFAYKCDNYYSPAHEAGISWNDATLKIDWKLALEDVRLSEKDKTQSKLEEIKTFTFEAFKQENVYK